MPLGSNPELMQVATAIVVAACGNNTFGKIKVPHLRKGADTS